MYIVIPKDGHIMGSCGQADATEERNCYYLQEYILLFPFRIILISLDIKGA